MSGAWQDVRYSVRTLGKSPGVTVFAVISLALGIGGNTAVFTLLNALVLRPLAVPDPQQLVTISIVRPDGAGRKEPVSLAAFEHIRREQHVFSAMFAWRGDYAMANFEANGGKYVSTLAEATGDYFITLGARPLLGRLLVPADAGLTVSVLDYRCWRDRFHSDPAIVGKTIAVQGVRFTIVGVTPEDFTGPVVEVAPEAVVPFGVVRPATEPKQTWVAVMARLKPGYTPEAARAQLQAIWAAARDLLVPAGLQPESRARFLAGRIDLQPAGMGISYTRERQERPLAALMALLSAVLLIACANLASLMLARAAARRPELAIRTALGAGRWRLIRQLLTESAMLSVMAATLAGVFAVWTARLLVAMSWSGYVPAVVNLTPDLRVLSFAAGLSFVTTLLFGLPPALQAVRLVEAARTTSGGARGPSKFFVSSQVALSVVLVTSAILLVRTLHNIRSEALGFRGEAILLVHLFPQAGRERIPERRLLSTACGDTPAIARVCVGQLLALRAVRADGGESARRRSRTAGGPRIRRTRFLSVDRHARPRRPRLRVERRRAQPACRRHHGDARTTALSGARCRRKEHRCGQAEERRDRWRCR